jgi:hypothetical protein
MPAGQELRIRPNVQHRERRSSAPTFCSTPSGTQGVRTADFNGDNKVDFLIIGLLAFQIYLGNGDGTFYAGLQIAALDGGTKFATLGKYNGNGVVDIVIVSSTGTAWTYLNDGTGNFAGTHSFNPAAIGPHPGAVAAGDFNHYGFDDQALTH